MQVVRESPSFLGVPFGDEKKEPEDIPGTPHPPSVFLVIIVPQKFRQV